MSEGVSVCRMSLRRMAVDVVLTGRVWDTTSVELWNREPLRRMGAWACTLVLYRCGNVARQVTDRTC